MRYEQTRHILTLKNNQTSNFNKILKCIKLTKLKHFYFNDTNELPPRAEGFMLTNDINLPGQISVVSPHDVDHGFCLFF